MAETRPTRGRRGGDADARGDILRAARSAFAAKAYGAVTLRGIARDAGVDPALIHHYFDGKPDLFVQAVIPHDDADRPIFPSVVEAITGVPRERVGEALVTTFVSTWDATGADRFAALVRGALSGDDALSTIRQFLFSELLVPLVSALGVDHPERRLGLLGSVLVGVGVARYVAELPGIPTMTPAEVAAVYGPTLQRILDAPIADLLRAPAE